MRRLFLSVLALLPAVMAHAVEPNGPERFPFFTWGARIGFNATGTYISQAVLDGKDLTNYEQDTQVGNFCSLQFRFNSSRLFFQSGVGLSSNKTTVNIDRNSWKENSQTTDFLTASFVMKSVTVPVQIGCHIINQSPYCMSVFTGPRFRYTPSKYYSASFINQNPYNLAETNNPLSVGWTIGLSILIERTFLDFEYEAGISNLSKSINDTSGAYSGSEFNLGHRTSILSFSYGIMF